LPNEFLFQDIYFKNNKRIIKSAVVPLSCYVCKKELNGISLTAKEINQKTVFLCSHHYKAKPYEISFGKK